MRCQRNFFSLNMMETFWNQHRGVKDLMSSGVDLLE